MHFDHSKNTKKKIIDSLRQALDCPATVKSVYRCFDNISLEQILNVSMSQITMKGFSMMPIADGDFFPDHIQTAVYDLSRR